MCLSAVNVPVYAQGSMVTAAISKIQAMRYLIAKSLDTTVV